MRYAAQTSGPPIPEIAFLGTSWHERGASYWLRRLLVTGIVTVFAAILVSALVAFLIGVLSQVHGGARVVVVLLVVAAVSWSCTSVLVQVRRKERQPVGRGPAGAGTLGSAARGGSPVAGALLFIGLLFAIGWFVVPVFLSMRRYLGPEEIAAVEGVQRWRAEHPGWSPPPRAG